MSTGQRHSAFRTQTFLALDELRSLRAGWNGYGAEPINPAIIDSARRLVQQLPEEITEAPRVVPMTKGRLQFEWHHGNRSLELEFQDQARIHYLKWDSDLGIENEEIIPASETQTIADLMRWFVSE